MNKLESKTPKHRNSKAVGHIYDKEKWLIKMMIREYTVFFGVRNA